MFANLGDKEKQQLNDFAGYYSYIHTWESKKFLNCTQALIGLFCGNQRGKGAMVSYNYVLRILGMHPVPRKNVLYFECANKHYYSPLQVKSLKPDNKCPQCNEEILPHKRGTRIIRFASESQPGQTAISSRNSKGNTEIKNTQYPELKKWLPDFLIRTDITSRNLSLTIIDPFGGDDIVIEHVSYGQTVGSQKGQQRLSTWCDEEPPELYFDEQFPRLFAEMGDLIVTFTPIEGITYLFDKVFEKASIVYRTKTICDEYYKKVENKNVPQIEHTGLKTDIAIIQAATDDNPIFEKGMIAKSWEGKDDLDQMYMRRFGIFKAISGRIFKNFNYPVHVISPAKYFKEAA